MADQGNEGLLSPWLRRRRFAAARPYLKGKVLDYGCGSGGLAEYVPADRYLGVDIDPASLEKARRKFPQHRFRDSLPAQEERFDTIVALAVIEHVRDPGVFLHNLAGFLSESPSARIIVTTPHPLFGWMHDIGAALGIFSKHASEEHEELLDRPKLEAAGSKAGLALIHYARFLLGANQIAVFKRAKR